MPQGIIRLKTPGEAELYLMKGEFPGLTAQREAVSSIIGGVIGGGTMLCHKPSGEPFLTPDGPFVSISHCSRAVGVAVSKKSPVGLDVETWRQQLIKVASRFLKRDEYNPDVLSSLFLTTAWTYKEAAWKLLQRSDEGLSTMMQVDLFDRRLLSTTFHLDGVTATVVEPVNW